MKTEPRTSEQPKMSKKDEEFEVILVQKMFYGH